MQDCDFYIDSEEDEVFFGCVNEKEKIICSGINNEPGAESAKNDDTRVSDSSIIELKQENSFETEFCGANNTSIDLDHNYSSMKQKIDKSILATPKRVVNADKDGGFLKVLSEIALAKAEADNNMDGNIKGDANTELNCNKGDEEDKENKVSSVPEIKITEPTPEKPSKQYVFSPDAITKPQKFIAYNSPNNMDNFEQKLKAKLLADNLGNVKNTDESMDQSAAKWIENSPSIKKNRGNSWPNNEDQNESVKLLELTNEAITEANKKLSDGSEIRGSNRDLQILEGELNLTLQKVESAVSRENSSGSLDSEAIIQHDSTHEKTAINSNFLPVKEQSNLDLLTSDLNVISIGSVATNALLQKGENEKVIKENLNENLTAMGIECKGEQSTYILSNREVEENNTIPKYRFSKEARKIVEILKTSAADETLNFTIPEINLEDMENSFISPQAVLGLEDTVIGSNNCSPQLESVEKSSGTMVFPSQHLKQCKSTEKMYCSPTASKNKIQTLRYFSDRKIQPSHGSQLKKCAKRLPTPGNLPNSTTKGVQSDNKKGSGCPASKIPVCGLKPTKLPLSCARAQAKQKTMTPYKGGSQSKNEGSRTPSNLCKSLQKFKNVASPISAYIHGKQTALVVNVKPQLRKEGFLKMLNDGVSSNTGKGIPARTPSKDVALPLVEYKSATPHKVVKQPESRLPRLAPTVQKLIGTNSPRIFKHEGRFYMGTPIAKGTSNNETILADRNEVSLVISQVAQKSNTIK